jgi:tRNA pseudouridine55 synthase
VIDGFLLVDKAPGWTSHDAVARVRKLARQKRVGHGGTLDPMATGLLVLGLGRATRLLRFIHDLPKTYVAEVQFGVATDTLDAEGAILCREEMDFGEEELAAVLPRFVGVIHQVPPMVSALKVEGRRLYDLAREGVEVERDARPVEVYRLELLEFAPGDYPEAVIRVVCGKGTYVRTLADDLARALGGRAHLTALRRTRSGGLSVDEAVDLDQLQPEDMATRVVDMAAGLADLPDVSVEGRTAVAVRNGMKLPTTALDEVPVEGLLRVLDAEGGLLAVYRVDGGVARAEVVVP